MKYKTFASVLSQGIPQFMQYIEHHTMGLESRFRDDVVTIGRKLFDLRDILLSSAPSLKLTCALYSNKMCG